MWGEECFRSRQRAAQGRDMMEGRRGGVGQRRTGQEAGGRGQGRTGLRGGVLKRGRSGRANQLCVARCGDDRRMRESRASQERVEVMRHN